MHHIQPELFDGFDETGVAVPEKAVFDLVWISAPQVATLVRGALRETLDRLHAEMAFG